MDAKNVYNGLTHLIEASCVRELPKPVDNGESKSVAENGELPQIENGEASDAKESEAINDEEVNKDPASQTVQEDTNLEKPLE